MPGSTRAERGPARVAGFLPHDLLEVASPDAIVADGPPAEWVRASLERAPFVVVRRAARRGALVPVGVRGRTRGERFGAWLPAAGVVRRIRPEDLAARRGWEARASRQLSALRAVERLMAAQRLRWGPVGGVGFELAAGVACLTPESDLDLIVRTADLLDRAGARRLHAALAALPVRVDVQLETPWGAVALAECAAGGARLVLRTPEGPRWITTARGAAGAGR